MKTVRQVAEIIGVTTGRVRQVATENHLGTNLHPRMKVFSAAEVERIKRLLKPSHLGRPRLSQKSVNVS